MVTRLVLFAFAVALAGCYTASHYTGDENSPYYVVPAGSHIVLHQALTVPPEDLGVFIQRGEARSRGQVGFSEPYCRFELKTLRNASRTIAPDDMIVRRSWQEMVRSLTRIPGEQYASAFVLLAASERDDPNLTLVTFATRMDLESQKQPEVSRLTCARTGYRGEDRHVTIAEIRATLGKIASLQLPR